MKKKIVLIATFRLLKELAMIAISSAKAKTVTPSNAFDIDIPLKIENTAISLIYKIKINQRCMIKKSSELFSQAVSYYFLTIISESTYNPAIK